MAIRLVLLVLLASAHLLGASKSKSSKPRCLLLWEKCMANHPHWTITNCDNYLFRYYSCAKPKPLRAGKGLGAGDYDYVILRETEDRENSQEVEVGHVLAPGSE